MSKGAETEYGVIPKGTWIKLFEGSVVTLQDVAIKADQAWIDQAIIDENNYRNGIGVVGDAPSQFTTGAMSAMHVSTCVGTQTNTDLWEKYSKDNTDKQSDFFLQKAIRDAAKSLNFANNARFINIVEWRTNMIDRLLSHISIKTIDDAIKECQKLEKHIFGEKEPDSPKDWRL